MALATFPVADDGARPSGLDVDAASLVRLLSATADRDGRRLAFRDQKDRERWSGRPPLEWSYSVARTIVGRLSRFFSGLGLARGSAVGVALSSGPEAWLSLLAIEDAGLAACLLPVGWPAEKLAQAIEAANVQAVATQGVLADLRPAELFCTLASRYFGLRFVCAFGPQIPDGVIDLDCVILVEEAAPVGRTAEAEASGIGRVTFSARAGEPRPIYRPARSFAASVMSVVTSSDVQAEDRVLTLLGPDTHAGLVTGLGLAMLRGATLEAHGLFDGETLTKAMMEERPAHLVAPGWMEPALAQSGLADRLASTILVHRAPVRFKAKTALKRNVLDVLAFDEQALIAKRRSAAGHFGLSFDAADEAGLAANLLRVKHESDGSLAFAGPAADIRPFGRYGSASCDANSAWIPSDFKAELFAGMIIGVS